jgi:hypothetical protein
MWDDIDQGQKDSAVTESTHIERILQLQSLRTSKLMAMINESQRLKGP